MLAIKSVMSFTLFCRMLGCAVVVASTLPSVGCVADVESPAPVPVEMGGDAGPLNNLPAVAASPTPTSAPTSTVAAKVGDTSAPGSFKDPQARCAAPKGPFPTEASIPNAVWTRSTNTLNKGSGPSRYLTAPFTVSTDSFTFNQAPSWAPDSRVLGGINKDSVHIYDARLDGSDAHCLTCTQSGDIGDNGLPQLQPQGQWVLFESTRGQGIEVGGDGLGVGLDSVWVMRPDGSCPVQLTGPASDDSLGFSDDFHAYWSPDGTKIIWTHLANSSFVLREADVIDDGVNPVHLANIINFGPPGEVYESELWAPDGSGVLFQYSDPADNQEVYFMRLFGEGASPQHPIVQHITDGNPGWDEQALFTPDMSAVIYMSSRDCPTCLYNIQTLVEQTLHVPQLPNGLDGTLYGINFFAAVLPADISPAFFSTDLYLLDLNTQAIRRLTDNHRVIPEFYFDAAGKTLIWSEGDNVGWVTKTASFQ